jgi:hypothetical protein
MRALLSVACINSLLLCFTQQGLSQIGESREELIRRYGPCEPNDVWLSEGTERAYHSVIDLGEDCTFRSNDLTITVLFKAGKAVMLDYRVKPSFSDSLVSGERYQKLRELDILRLLFIAAPNARWVEIPSDSTVRRSRTKDSTLFAYYFAGGYLRHQLLVQTATVDAVFKKVLLPLVRRH